MPRITLKQKYIIINFASQKETNFQSDSNLCGVCIWETDMQLSQQKKTSIKTAPVVHKIQGTTNRG